MAGQTKVNGIGHTHDTNYSVAQLQGFEVDALVDISGKGGLGSTIEAIVQEMQPLIYKSAGTAGKILMICDGHANTAASMQVRLRALGTVDSIDLSSATVTARDLDDFDIT